MRRRYSGDVTNEAPCVHLPGSPSALSEEEIQYYVDKYQPMDKAGAYGVQEWIGYIGVKSISGSFYNIMGLPIQKLYGELKKL